MKRMIGFNALVLAACLATAPSVVEADVVYENNYAGWRSAAGSIETINWDDVGVANGASTTIAAARYNALSGSPTLSVDAGSGLYVVDPDNPSLPYFGSDFFPTSGENVFSPDDWASSPEGILTVTFDTDMTVFGVWFLDVEQDYDATGIKIGSTLYAFSGNQGDNGQNFLGIVSDTGFDTAEVHMSSDSGGNGVGIDDLMYGAVPPEEVRNDAIAVIPVPGALMLGAIGITLVGANRAIRRRRRAA